jgi:uncharacterized delta-60 repeat protein
MTLVLSFSALQAASPPVSRPTATSITATGATLGGYELGGDEIGVVYSATATNSNPLIGGTGVTKVTATRTTGFTTGVFTAAVTGLTQGTLYSYRAYAINSQGTGYSIVGTFTAAAPGTTAGDLDTGFNPNANGGVSSLAVQADGKVLIGGNFTTVGGVARISIARLNADGSLDTGFNPPNTNGGVYSLAVQADGKVLIGGRFTTVGGVERNYVARLNADGSLDTGFNPNASNFVHSLAVQADGKVLIGGEFTTVGGVARNRVARLNADGSLDTGFNPPNADSTVYSLAVQPDGRVLIGGVFTTVGGVERNGIARLNADGSLDTGFNPNANRYVYSLAVQADGKVLIGGNFTTVGGVERNGIARLNANGSLDTGFNPNANLYANANRYVYSLAVQADGKVLIGGNFDSVGGVARDGIARLNADGTLDTGFNPNANGGVSSLAVQADGKVLIGGNFTTVGGVARNRIARVGNDPATQSLTIPDATQLLWSRSGTAPDVDGVVFESSTDNGATWSLLGAGTRMGSSANWQLTGLSLGAGAKVRATGRAVGGYFNGSSGLIRQAYPMTLAGVGSTLNASVISGSAGAPAMVLGGAVISDGGGVTERGFVYALSATNTTPEIGGTGVAKLAASGTEVGSFSTVATALASGATYSYRSYATNSAGTAYSAVGTFTTSAYGTVAGDLDTGFNPNADSTVYSLAVQADGKVLIGGGFTTVGGVARNYVARLNADGSLDTSFNPNASSPVYSLAVQADGKVLIGGNFFSVGGVARNRIARLNADGSLDTGFNPNANGYVYSLAVQADGKVLIGGGFDSVSGVARNYVTRLNADGSLDTGFNPNASNFVHSLAVQADGKVLIGGVFDSVSGVARNRIARLNADGSLDTGFNPNANSPVRGLAVQADGKVVIVGEFTTVGGVERICIARLNADGSLDTGFNPNANGGVSSLAVQADGKVLIGGDFDSVGGVARDGIARLNADGTLDTGFNPNANGGVSSLAVQADGKVLIGGNFTTVGGVARNRIARVGNDPATQSLTIPDATQLLWSRSGTAPDVDGVVFESSTDNGATWSLLGAGTRMGSSANWQLTGLSLGAGAKVRATGRAVGGYFNGSSGLIRQAYPMTLAGVGSTLNATPATGSASGGGTSAMALGGVVISDGGGVTERGFVYALSATNATPEIGGTGVAKLAASGTEVGSFSTVATALASGATYSYRSYATNSAGTAYSAVGTFTTSAYGTVAGDLDTGFNPNADSTVYSLAVQADGKVLIGGEFDSVGGVDRTGITRLNADGSLDTGFNPNANGYVYSLAVQADGKVLIGGNFYTVGGVERNGIARLNADGSLDTGFNPNADGEPYSLAVQADGKVLIGGSFTTVGGVERNGIARLNADGSLDTGFNPLNADSTVYSLAVQADGKVLIGGEFTTVGGVARNRVARLNADGSLDTGFNPLNADSTVYSLAVQADGKVLIGGVFTTVGGVERNGIARLNANGSLDTGFNPNANLYANANRYVFSLAVQVDGKVLIGGNFDSVGGVARDGIARLNADGTLDTGFNPNANGGVSSLAVQADGKVLIGGDFTTVGEVARNRIARVGNDPATQSLTIPDATQVLWTRGGSAPEVSDVVFESSTDNGASWSLLGAGTRMGSSANWQLTGLSLGAGAKVRATGRAVGGYFNGSSGLIRQVGPAMGIGSLASSSIGTTTATLGATNTVDDILVVVTERGFVYAATGTNSNPVIGGTGVTQVTATGTTGAYTSDLSGLSAGTGYSYKAYVISSEGISYTSGSTFTTLSVNADVSALALSSGTLSPVFDSGTTSYTASVANVVSSITVTPTRAEANATIEARVNTGTYASVSSGSASGALALNVGSNTVDVRVTAQDGVTTKTYTVTVTRAALNPTYTTGSEVPVTSNGYTATGNALGTVTLGTAPTSGQVLTVVNNTVAGAVSGTFTGLDEGATMSTTYGGNTFTFRISYAGGDGNDITLTRVGAAGQVTNSNTYAWTTLAGSLGGVGSQDGTAARASFYNPTSTAVDSAGNVYVADSNNHTIRKITSAGVVTTLAGSAGSFGSTDGTGSAARFYNPQGVAVDSAGNVYVADSNNNTIRKISSAGVVTTLADSAGQSGSTDGTGSAARFSGPRGLAVDSAGNVYVADQSNHTIRKISSAGVVTTLAGSAGQSGSTDGTGSAARFFNPTGVAVDSSGNVYVADQNNQTIRKISSAGVVTTLAGSAGLSGSKDGTGSAARLSYPTGVAVDSVGNVYVANYGNSTIRKITSAGVVTTLAGSAGQSGSADGTGSAARFSSPRGVAVDSGGNVYVADSNNHTIRKVTAAGVVTTLAGSALASGSTDGTGSGTGFDFNGWGQVAADSSGNLYVAEYGSHTIRKITRAGVVTTLAGSAGLAGSTDGTGSAARFYLPMGVAVDGAGTVYVADTFNLTIRKISSAGVVTTLAGSAGLAGSTDGTGSAARFNYLQGAAVDSTGNVYVADSDNHTIRKITPAGVVTTLAGSAGLAGSTDGTGSAARFYRPRGVAVESGGNVYVADSNNNRIRKISSAGVVTTLAGDGGAGSTDGTGTAARFNFPVALAVSSAGTLYVADTSNSTIRQITSTGVVNTIGGLAGRDGHETGIGSSARFYGPVGVTASSSGVVYVTDRNNRVVQGQPAGFQPVVTRGAVSGSDTTVATLNGTVNPNGFVTTAQFEYGTSTSYGSTAAVTLSPNDDTTAQNVSASLTGLTAGTVYYYRLTATNVDGTQNTSGGTFTTLMSSDANLSALALSSGTLSPVFDSGTTAYTASVSSATTSITVTATRAEANATIEARVNTGTYASVTSGSPSASLALNFGSNTLDARVTAQDGTTQKTYTVTVTRMATPTVTTPTATSITANSAILGGTVASVGGGRVLERGLIYSEVATNAAPELGGIGVNKLLRRGSVGAFTGGVAGLSPATTYAYRAYMKTSVGTSYSGVGYFTTNTPLTFTAGIGTLAGRVIRPGESQLFTFDLADSSLASFSSQGASGTQAWEVSKAGFDSRGKPIWTVIGSGTGDAAFANPLTNGSYSLRLTNNGASTDTVSLNLDGSNLADPRPDISGGSSAAGAEDFGADIYDPTVQEVIQSTSEAKARDYYFLLGNDGPVPDAMKVSATITGRPDPFQTMYKVGIKNVTAAIRLGTYTTPVLSSSDDPVLLFCRVSPNRSDSRIHQKVLNEKGKLVSQYRNETFNGLVRSTAATDSTINDSIEVRLSALGN